MNFARFAAPVALTLTVSACGINTIPTYEEEAKARWADVQASYQRRADLVPNLVETVRGFANQEREVLREVTEARASATQVQINPDQLNDPAAVERFQQAQSNLSGALGRLLVTVEKYPELRSQENFLALQSQLEGTENRINVAIRDYNEAVRQYNTEIRTFPGVVGARVVYGAQPLQPYQAVTPGAERAPTVKF